MSKSPLHSLRAEFALVFVALIWGSTFVLVKSALSDVSTLLFLSLRFSFAGVVLGIVYRRKLSGVFSRRGSKLKGGVVVGICIFSGYMFQTFGLRLTTPSKSAFLTGMFIVLVPLLHAVIYRVTPRPSERVGVVVALLGMGLMTLDGTQLSANPGDLLTLVGAFFYALHVIALGHFAPRDGFERLSVLQTTTAAALGLSTFWWVETPFIEWTATVLLALAVTGLFATAVAFSLQSWAQQHTSPTRTALILALEPVFAGATSFLLLGEVLSGRALAGAALILVGILLVELKPLGRKNHP